VFGYPLLALGFGLLILAALSPGRCCIACVPGAASLALWSYAIYLTHKQVRILVAPAIAEARLRPGDPARHRAALAQSVLAGWLLYRLVETPFMALRERYVPSNLAGGGRGLSRCASMTSKATGIVPRKASTACDRSRMSSRSLRSPRAGRARFHRARAA
jgi:peptidoglycan/LPS O-acetylase OafA/YrhL